jgi:hypothetical protein
MTTLAILLCGVWCLVVITALIERITEENRPVPGCGCGGGCRGR